MAVKSQKKLSFCQKCGLFTSALLLSTLVTGIIVIVIWIFAVLFGGWYFWYLFIEKMIKCRHSIHYFHGLSENSSLSAHIKELKCDNTTDTNTLISNNTDLTTTEVTSYDLTCDNVCSDYDLVQLIMASVILLVGSLIFLGVFLFWCIRFTREDYARLRGKNIGLPDPHSVVVEQDPQSVFRCLEQSNYCRKLDVEQDLQTKEHLLQLINSTWIYENRLGKDSKALKHKGIQVKEIYTVKNEKLWQKYNEGTSSKNREFGYPSEITDKPILTTKNNVSQVEQEDLTDSVVTPLFHCEPTNNEVYLFHGTKVNNILGIIEGGFDLNRARNGLYGKAIYLAESSEKADQYADYSSKRREKDLAMLVVRVKLGRVHCHDKEGKVHVPYSGRVWKRKPKYQTVVAGLKKRFREFLVFNQKHCYPEYVITYDRLIEQ